MPTFLKLLLTATATTAFLAGCSRSSESAATQPAGGPEPVRMVLNWLPEPEFGGIYAAQELGIFKKHGLDVRIISGGPDVPTLDMTAAGKADFGIAAADEVVKARSEGRKLRAIFAAFQTNPQGIMTHAERGFHGIEDVLMSTDTLALQPGLAYVAYLGWKYPQHKAPIVRFEGGTELFLAKAEYAQQCFVFSEPIDVGDHGAKTNTFLIAESGFNPYATVTIASDDYVRGHPAAVKAMAAALREGWQAYLKDPGPTNAAIAKMNKQMAPATMAKAAAAQTPYIESDGVRAQPIGSMTLERWQTLIGQLIDCGYLKADKAPRAEECFVAVGE